MAAEKIEDGENRIITPVTPDSPAAGDPVQPRPSMVVTKGSDADAVQPPELISKKKVWHDLKNILGPVVGYTSMASRGCQHLLSIVSDPVVFQGLSEIREYLARCGIGLDSLREYFEVQGMEVLDISGILEEVIACREHVWQIEGAPVVVEKIIASGLKIFGNKDNLKQILCNLLNNAHEACKGVQGRKPNIQVTLEQSGSFVKCTIRDNGCGMSDEVKERAGREEFTTKPEGLGLGVKTSVDRLNEIDGLLDFENNSTRKDLEDEPGEKYGVSATIRIPAIVADQESL